MIDDCLNNSSGIRDDSGIVFDVFVFNISFDLLLMDVNIIEYFFNFFSRSDFMYLLFLIINVLYIGVNDY